MLIDKWGKQFHSTMTTLLAIYGSPRKNGNTALLLHKTVEGPRDAGTTDTELYAIFFHKGIDLEGDILNYPQQLKEAYEKGKAFSLEIIKAANQQDKHV